MPGENNYWKSTIFIRADDSLTEDDITSFIEDAVADKNTGLHPDDPHLSIFISGIDTEEE